MRVFQVTRHDDGAHVVSGPGGDYVAVSGQRLALAFAAIAERAYRHGARDAVSQGGTCVVPAITESAAPDDESPAAVDAVVTLGIPRRDATKLLERVRNSSPQLRCAGDLVRAMLALRSIRAA